MEEKLIQWGFFEIGERVLIKPGSRFYVGGPTDSNPKDIEGTIVTPEGEWMSVEWDNGTKNGYEMHDLMAVDGSKMEMVDSNKIYLEETPVDLPDVFQKLYPPENKYGQAMPTYYKSRSDGRLLLHCPSGKMRSFDDIWILADTYFPNVDVREVFKEMLLFNTTIEDFNSGVVKKSLSNCSTMKRIRFTNSKNKVKCMWDSSSCNKYDSVYKWIDLFNMIHVNNYDQFLDWYKTELTKRSQLEKLELKTV